MDNALKTQDQGATAVFANGRDADGNYYTDRDERPDADLSPEELKARADLKGSKGSNVTGAPFDRTDKYEEAKDSQGQLKGRLETDSHANQPAVIENRVSHPEGTIGTQAGGQNPHAYAVEGTDDEDHPGVRLLLEFVRSLHGQPKTQRLENVYNLAIRFLNKEDIADEHLDFSGLQPTK